MLLLLLGSRAAAQRRAAGPALYGGVIVDNFWWGRGMSASVRPRPATLSNWSDSSYCGHRGLWDPSPLPIAHYLWPIAYGRAGVASLLFWRRRRGDAEDNN